MGSDPPLKLLMDSSLNISRRRPNKLSYENLEQRRLLATLVAENFEVFDGSGFTSSPSAAQLDSDLWRITGLSDGNGAFGGNHTSGDFARGVESNPIFSGGIYAFEVGGNRVLGTQPTGGDMTPGSFDLQVANTTGGDVTEWTVNYDLWFRNDQERATTVELSYSTDDSSYTPVPSVDFSTPEASDTSGWTFNPFETTISVTVADGGSLYFRWSLTDESGSGSRDEIGLDEVTVNTDGSGGGNTGAGIGGIQALDLRIVSYNVANLPRTSAADADFRTVFSAISQETRVGVARDIDLLVLQETDPISIDRIEGIMDGLYSQDYAFVLSNNFSGDYFGYVFNTETLSLLETERIDGGVNYTRDPLRALFKPVGSVGDAANFHVFNVHLNAGDEVRRQLEANGIRAELNSLGADENYMVVGDLNIDSSSEGSYSTLTASGIGQVSDPLNSPGNWNDNNSFKSIHTQNPAGPMDDRFDFQLLNDDLMSASGLGIIPGSYRAFGNNGTHNLNQSITTGSGASSTVLSALADASDHLPVVVDYRYDIAAVASAGVFYNDSSFDAAGDLDAIANKAPLMPGSTATFENYSSYASGINGMVLEVQEFATAPTLATVEQFFDFKQGNSNDVSSWADAALPNSLTYAEDINASGTDRIVLTWADDAVKNIWLEVTALANSTTGILATQTFYFGNAPGETGNDPANAIVNLADVALTRQNQTGFGSADIGNLFDFDRDGKVNLVDVALARGNQSGFTPLQLITPGASGRSAGSVGDLPFKKLPTKSNIGFATGTMDTTDGIFEARADLINNRSLATSAILSRIDDRLDSKSQVIEERVSDFRENDDRVLELEQDIELVFDNIERQRSVTEQPDSRSSSIDSGFEMFQDPFDQVNEKLKTNI